MTWEEIRAHVLATRKVLEDEGRRLMIALAYADPATSQTLVQRVELTPAEALGRPWVTLWADACAVNDVDPHRALVHNATLAIGSIVIDEHHYFLRHVGPAATLTPELLDLTIDLLAHEAVRLRARRPLERVAGGASAAPYAE